MVTEVELENVVAPLITGASTDSLPPPSGSLPEPPFWPLPALLLEEESESKALPP